VPITADRCRTVPGLHGRVDGGVDDLVHALEPEGGASGTLAGSRERAATVGIGEDELGL